MCQGNPVLRVLGFSFLLIAFLAAIVAFLVPFWIRNEKADPEGFSIAKLKSMVHDKFKDSTEIPTSTLPYRGQTIFRQLEDNRKKRENLASQLVTMVSKLKPTPRQEEDVWFWEGLWANCQTNFSCTCVFEDEMALEKASSDWFKATQGLYSLSLVLYLLALLIGGFYLCCRCCKESIKLATTLGSFVLSAIILLALALVVYGGFSFMERGVQFDGHTIVFEWGYFLAMASLVPAILSAIFYLVDGCRSTIVVEHDDCELAKMV